MSLSHSPQIVTNDLVFYYDMNNIQKSWVGKPTTNVITNKLPTAGWTVSNYLTSSANTTFESENGIPHLKITNVVYDSAYPRLVDSSLISTVSDGFSLSFEAKGTIGAQLVLSLYSSGSTKSQNFATLTGTWQKYTFENIITGFTIDQPYLNPRTTGATYYVRNIQVEQNPFSTPFTSNTRSNTQSVIDLTGQNTITAANLVYKSDGTFTFTPNVNYMSVNGPLGTLANNITLMAVTKVGNPNGPHATAICTHQNYRAGLKLMPDYWNQLRAWAADGVGGADFFASGPNLENTGTNIIACTRDAGTGVINLYLNGSLTSSGTGNTGPLYMPDTAGARIGIEYHSGAYGCNGDIFMAMAYNRVLTPLEIQQNFNALRGRYGI